jgi:UPF0755 protein
MRPIRQASLTLVIAAVITALGSSTACREADRRVERLSVRRGATLREVTDTLAAHAIVRRPGVFRAYARLRGVDHQIKPGTYDIPRAAGWSEVLDLLVAGRGAIGVVTVPEGWTARQIAERIAPISGTSADSAARRLFNPALADSLGAPGPTLEGYLFPATYDFASSRSLEDIAARMVRRYRQLWTPARRARLDSLGMTEREIVTLASIIQAESRWADEMPIISAIFHNRLRQGMPLQSDPTVLYALPPNTRLRHRQIDSLAGHPYNTYSKLGVPPGPIGSPGEAAINAALHPASVPYLYFVARGDGRHEFSRTFREHREAIDRTSGAAHAGQASQSDPLSEADSAAIKQVAAAHLDAVLRRDADAVAALYAENAVQMPPGQPVVEGRPAIRAALEAGGGSSFLERVSFWSLTPSYDGHGDGFVYDWGTYWLTVGKDSAAEQVPYAGKYVVLLRKELDGSWRIAWEIWTADQAPSP